MKKYILILLAFIFQTSFSQNIFQTNDNVGIGITNPLSRLAVSGSITLNGGLINSSPRPSLTSGNAAYGEIRAFSLHGSGLDDGFLRLCAGGGTNSWTKTYIDISGYSTVPDMNRNIVLGTSGLERMRITYAGNIGIGVSAPDSKLTVAGNIHAQEVKVTVNAGVVPDYVFANDYNLRSLDEVEQYIKENNHLPEIPSAKCIEKDGLMLAEMNLNLLKKIEELTLYIIEQNKDTEKLKAVISDQNIRLEKLEKK